MSKNKNTKDAARAEENTDFQPPHDSTTSDPWPETTPTKITELPKRPETPDQLHQWLVDVLDVRLPRTPVNPTHTAPFDYLIFTFFEGALDGSAVPASPPDCVLWANRGGGKTFLGALATLLDMLYKPGIAVRILAGSVDQAQRMLAHLHRFLSPTHPFLGEEVKGKPTTTRIELKNGSEVEVLSQSQTSVRGTHVQKLRCDEVDLFDPQIWEAAQFVTRSMECEGRLVRGSVECLSTMHEPHGLMQRLITETHEGKRRLFRWGVVDVLEHCDNRRLCNGWSAPDPLPLGGGPGAGGDGASSTQATTDTAPTLSLPVLPYASLAAPCPLLQDCQGTAKRRAPKDCGHAGIEDAIVTKGRVSLEAWESEMLCLRPKRTGVVIPEFNREKHIFKGDGPGRHRSLTWLAGMDFGMRSPTVILWAALDHTDAIWIMDERYLSDVVLERHILAMKSGLTRPGIPAWPRPRWVAADPAGHHINPPTGASACSVLRKYGFDVRTPSHAVSRGVDHIRARLGPAAGLPRLFIHERCTNLIRSLESYRYKPGVEAEEPLKDGNDHAVDALRYLVTSVDLPCETKSGSYLVA